MARVVSSWLLGAFFFASGEFSARDYEPASATVAIAGSPVHRARAAEVVDGRLPRALRPRTNEIISLASSLGFVARRWLPLWGNGEQSGLIESFVRSNRLLGGAKQHAGSGTRRWPHLDTGVLGWNPAYQRHAYCAEELGVESCRFMRLEPVAIRWRCIPFSSWVHPVRTSFL